MSHSRIISTYPLSIHLIGTQKKQKQLQKSYSKTNFVFRTLHPSCFSPHPCKFSSPREALYYSLYAWDNAWESIWVNGEEGLNLRYHSSSKLAAHSSAPELASRIICIRIPGALVKLRIPGAQVTTTE